MDSPFSFSELQNVFGKLAEDYGALKELAMSDEDMRIYFEELCNFPVSVVSKEGTVLFVNMAYEKFTGFSKSELIGKSVMFFGEVPAEQIRKRLKDRENNIREQYDLTVHIKNSPPKTIWVDSRPFRDKEGRFVGSLLTTKDIKDDRSREEFIKHNTEYLEAQIEKYTRDLKLYAKEMETEIRIREEAQRALLETDKQLRTIFYNSPDPLFLEEFDGTIIDINDAAARLHGYTREEMIGANVKTFNTPESLAFFDEIQSKLIAGTLHRFEIEIVHSSGKIIPVAVNASVIEYSGRSALLLQSRDISERIRHQKELEKANKLLDEKVIERTQELENANRELRKEIAFRTATQKQLIQQYDFFQTLIDINPNLIFIKNREQQYMLVNDAFAKFLGKSKDKIIGRTLNDIIRSEVEGYPSHLFEEQDEIVLQQVDTHFEFIIELESKYQRGTYYKMIKQAVKAYESDEYLIMGVMIDLSEFKENEINLTKTQQELQINNIKLQHSNEELERFAYIASHDLQSPLKTVISFLQLLEQRYGNKVGSEGKEFIEYCVSASARMRQLITDLLQYSRLNAEPKFSNNVDVNKLLYVVTRNLEANIKSKNAIIHAGNLPMITAEPYLVVQLLQNIVDNGIKFVENKQPVIHISFKETGKHWHFSISDNGIGVSPEYQEKIFKIFHRLHANNEYSGTGIGLAICKKVVEIHHGEIWVDSQVNDGSTFHFTLAKNIERISKN